MHMLRLDHIVIYREQMSGKQNKCCISLGRRLKCLWLQPAPVKAAFCEKCVFRARRGASRSGLMNISSNLLAEKWLRSGTPRGNLNAFSHLFMHFVPVNYTGDNSFSAHHISYRRPTGASKPLLNSLKFALITANVWQFACHWLHYSKTTAADFTCCWV